MVLVFVVVAGVIPQTMWMRMYVLNKVYKCVVSYFASADLGRVEANSAKYSQNN